VQKIRNEVLCPNISHTNHLGPSKLSNVFDLLSTHSSPAILIHGPVCSLTIIIGIAVNRSIKRVCIWLVILQISWPIQKCIRKYSIKFSFEQLKIVFLFYFISLRNFFYFFSIFFVSFYVKLLDNYTRTVVKRSYTE